MRASHAGLRAVILLGAILSAPAAVAAVKSWPVHDGWSVDRTTITSASIAVCMLYGGALAPSNDGSPERLVGIGFIFGRWKADVVMIDQRDNLPRTARMTFAIDNRKPFAVHNVHIHDPGTGTELEDVAAVASTVSLVRSHRRLTVASRGQLYRIELKGFSAAVDDLDECRKTLP
jgi:hypothetical protein